MVQGRNSGKPVTGSWVAKTDDALGERRLAHVAGPSNRCATVAQIAEKINAGSDRNV